MLVPLLVVLSSTGALSSSVEQSPFTSDVAAQIAKLHIHIGVRDRFPFDTWAYATASALGLSNDTVFKFSETQQCASAEAASIRAITQSAVAAGQASSTVIIIQTGPCMFKKDEKLNTCSRVDAEGRSTPYSNGTDVVCFVQPPRTAYQEAIDAGIRLLIKDPLTTDQKPFAGFTCPNNAPLASCVVNIGASESAAFQLLGTQACDSLASPHPTNILVVRLPLLGAFPA